MLHPIIATAIFPTALFVALWIFVRPENRSVAESTRVRLALLSGSFFLAVGVLTPPVFNREMQMLAEFRFAVLAACALGLALSVLRLTRFRRRGAMVLFVLSLGFLILSGAGYVGRPR